MKYFYLFLLSFNFLGCASESTTLSLDPFKKLSGELSTETNSIEGSGDIIFNNSLGSIDSGSNFSLSFSLNDGSSIKLFSYSDTSLENGVETLLSRSGNKLLAKVGELDAQELTGVNANEAMELSIDIHNDESPAHFLIWNASETEFNPETSLIELDAEEAVGNGSSVYWGLRLSDAKVTKANASTPKFEEE